MQLSAVLLARAFFFVETNDLNPRGTAFFPDVIRAIVQRFNFQKFPHTFEELDENKGVVFELGKFEGHTIPKVILYSNGIALDTMSSTKESEAILDSALQWARTLGLDYRPEMIKRRAYLSQITFYSDVPLLFIHPILRDFSARIGNVVSANLNLPYRFEP